MSPTEKKTSPGAKLVVLQQFEELLKKATEKKASDIHLKVGLPAIIRVNGSLFYLGQDANKENVTRLTADQLQGFADALMNPRQKEKYEQGLEVDLGYELAGSSRFRINICQQRSHPRFVCRLIPETIKTIEELGLPKGVTKLASEQRGLVLVTGVTGSGKSTTLAAMIDHISRNRSCHIVTLEDPIEFSFKDRKSIITQREIGIDTKDFVHGLKYALRQDPDVILIGEMRDEETVMMALAAAETGHLVFSTLHTMNATETINRILTSVSPGMQVQARAQLSAVLTGVISQRLVKKVDGKGRIAAVEVLVQNQRIRDMIADPDRTSGISNAMEESNDQGMQSFDQSLMQLLTEGHIDKEEALRCCSNAKDFQLKLSGVRGGRVVNLPGKNAPKTIEASGLIEIDLPNQKKK